MLIEGYIPRVHVQSEVKSKEVRCGLLQFKMDHPKATIEAIDGKEINGICEACGLPMYVTQEWTIEHESNLRFHLDCYNKS